MKTSFSTASAGPLERHRLWQDVIGQTYFNLQLEFLDPLAFQGSLSSWKLGELSLSHLDSAPIKYRRHHGHLSEADGEQFLVALPSLETIHFSQMGRDAECQPGYFVLERSNDPYEFSHPRTNSMWVLKIPGVLLRRHLRSPERYCALPFDGTRGVSALFLDYLHSVGRRLQLGDGCEHPLVGQQLLELFVAATEANPHILSSNESVVRAAHLQRIEAYVRQHITEPDLSPDQIAAACWISTRYLHALFKDTGQTLSSWLREQRLEGARNALVRKPQQSLATLAYQWGFTDQSHFSRVFKQHYGCTPKEERERQLLEQARGRH